jgi:hypothetical protein
MQRAAGSRAGAGGVAAHRLHDGGPTFILFAVIVAYFLVAQRFLGGYVVEKDFQNCAIEGQGQLP